MADQVRQGAKKVVKTLSEQGDERALRAPAKVRKYTVQIGDSLAKIAEQQMGNVEEQGVLKAHNLSVGLLFEDLRLYAGSELEIPEYDKVVSPATPVPPSSPQNRRAVEMRIADWVP